MNELLNVWKGHAANMDAQAGVAQHGTVVSVNPNNATVKVQVDDEGTTTGWLPVVQLAAGGGWSGVCLPTPGTQVFMVPDMGDQSHGVVVGAVHSTQQVPGKPIPYQGSAQPLTPGEVTFMHSSGASLRLTAGGVIEIHGTLKVDGDILASGNVTDLNNAHGSLDTLRQAYLAHKHSGVQSGASLTGLTDHPTP